MSRLFARGPRDTSASLEEDEEDDEIDFDEEDTDEDEGKATNIKLCQNIILLFDCVLDAQIYVRKFRKTENPRGAKADGSPCASGMVQPWRSILD